jgi:hypothetical protein
MKIRNSAVLVVVIISLSLILGATKQLSPNINSASKKIQLSDSQIPLQGLEAINVSFVGDDSAVVENRIWPDIELKLKLAGVKVVSDYDYKRAYEQGLHYPFIILNTGLGSAFFISQNLDTQSRSISLELHDTVLLARDPNTSFCAAIWSDSSICLFTEENRFDKQCEITVRLFTKFLNDYLAANPKELTKQAEQQKPK